jgi:hypothetical protein
MSSRSSRRLWLLTTLAILFFCSGVCALIYQVLWLRMLGWVFGVTGSFAAGKMGDGVRNPLRWFGGIEPTTALSRSTFSACRAIGIRI